MRETQSTILKNHQSTRKRRKIRSDQNDFENRDVIPLQILALIKELAAKIHCENQQIITNSGIFS
jgi:hypothetical protein